MSNPSPKENKKLNKQTLSTSNDIQELWRGQSLDLLKALHILTSDGKLNADSRRKLKQVYHLTQLIQPLIDRQFEQNENPVIMDVGAGKSYLGFILYDLILSNRGAGSIIAIESRAELISQSKKLAQQSQFDRMKFIESKIESVSLSEPLSMVCALHACDTATDDAILFGIKHQTKSFALVPCCQAEVARLLDQHKKEIKPEWSSLIRFPIHAREFGSHVTNVMRVLFLESKGYQVTVTELVGYEHSLKNEIILAEWTGKPNLKSLEQLKSLQQELKITPKLLAE